MNRRKPPSADDIALFREAVGDVRPVVDDRAEAPRKPPSTRPKSANDDDRAVMRALLDELDDADLLDSGEHLAWARAGVQRSVLRKLRSGRYAIQGELDLHGLTVNAARTALGEFLEEASATHRSCVRVIHGKGRHGVDSAPRLKPAVNAWLQRSRHVLAFCSARGNDGGTGAVYVLLRRV